jgi:hypothetical protein
MENNDMVLYVAKDKKNNLTYCKGSTMCLKILEALSNDFLNVQDCDTLRNNDVKLPSWLNGTPTLISKESGEIYKGTNAIQFLREQLDEYSDNINRKKEEKNRVSPTSMYEKDNQHDEDDEYEDDEDEKSSNDPWGLVDNTKVERNASDLDSQPRATQQDVEEFMRKRQSSMSQPERPGAPPTIEQTPS